MGEGGEPVGEAGEGPPLQRLPLPATSFPRTREAASPDGAVPTFRRPARRRPCRCHGRVRLRRQRWPRPRDRDATGGARRPRRRQGRRSLRRTRGGIPIPRLSRWSAGGGRRSAVGSVPGAADGRRDRRPRAAGERHPGTRRPLQAGGVRQQDLTPGAPSVSGANPASAPHVGPVERRAQLDAVDSHPWADEVGIPGGREAFLLLAVYISRSPIPSRFPRSPPHPCPIRCSAPAASPPSSRP
jgi:hypothetical protein